MSNFTLMNKNKKIFDFEYNNEEHVIVNFTRNYPNVAPIFDNGCSLWFDENDIYVGEFFLTKPFEEYEKKQVNLIKNISWLDINKLEGFSEEVREILSSNKLLTNERIEKIIKQIKLRIEYINKLKQEKEAKN